MLLRVVRWGLAGVLVAWTVVRAFGLDRAWPLVQVLAFTPYAAALAVVVAVLALLLHRRLYALVVGACAVVLAGAVLPRAIPSTADDAEGARLRVLAVNVAADPEAAARVVALARRERADVLSVLELPAEVAQAYEAAGLGELLPHRLLETRPGFAGSGLYARLPLTPLPAPDTHFATAAAAAAPRGAAPVELLAVHARAPTGRAATGIWRRDLRALPATGPVGPVRVLAGDFNATLDHAELRRLLRRGYRDAAEQAGTGLRPTWSTQRRVLPALVTIDHVLADERVRVASAHSVTIPGSDHRGVIAELVLPRTDRGGG